MCKKVVSTHIPVSFTETNERVRPTTPYEDNPTMKLDRHLHRPTGMLGWSRWPTDVKRPIGLKRLTGPAWLNLTPWISM